MAATTVSLLLALAPLHEPEPSAAAEPASAFDRLDFDAAGRMRYEGTFDQPNGEDRHRGRMRLRIGAHYPLTDEVRAHARLSTLSDGGDANNPHWDFGDGDDGFRGGDLVLDRFYLDWAARDSLSLRAGKFAHAYSRPPSADEFLWDGDVQPAGLALVWAPPKGRTDLRLVEYVAVENGGDSDPAMHGVQGNLYLALDEGARLQLSSSYSKWTSLGSGGSQLGNQGNTDVEGDFGILDAFALWAFEGGPLGRTEAFVEYLLNTEDDADEDTGYVAGARFGPGGTEGDLNLFATWYELDANAVYSPVSEDDTPIPGTGLGTGMTGVLAGAQYFLTDDFSVKLWTQTSDAGASEDPYRIRLDFDFAIR